MSAGAEEDEVRSGGLECFCGDQVEEVGGCMERLHPERGRCRYLEQKGANNIISGANNAFSFTVLGGGAGAGHAQVNAMCQEERAGAGVVELFTVVALDVVDGDAELYCVCTQAKK